MKKLLAILLSILLLMACVPLGAIPVSAATSGTTGDCTWTLDDDGNLTISGNGAMADYITEHDYYYGGYRTTAPWGWKITSVTIEKGVTSIGERAFYSCDYLTSVTISDSVTVIEREAFYSCNSLPAIDVSEGNLNYCDVDGVLFNKEKTTLIQYPGGKSGNYSVPDSVTTIENYAFSDIYSLTSVTIGGNGTTIGFEAFENCIGLTSVIIGDGVTTIADGAFASCDNLKSVTIGNGVTSIEGSAFSDSDAITSVYISDLAAWCGIDFDSAFSNPLYYAKELYLDGELVTNLVIPDGVTSIKWGAFHSFDALTSVTIPDSVTTIDRCAFFGCTSLESVTIGDSVTTIGYSAFNSCTALVSLTIGNSVTTVGESTFEDCASLTSVTIPDSVTTIESDAFSGCDALTSVYISDITAWCGIDFASASSNPLYYAKELYLDGELVTNLAIPDSVTTIEDYAFCNYSALTSVTIPDSVTTIGSSAFSNTAYYKNNANWENDILYIGHHLIDAKLTVSGAYAIKPGTLTIAGFAFAHCDALTSVTIPDGVTSIGWGAFYDCDSLTSVTIPNSVTTIGDRAFYECTSLTSVTIPDGVTTIESNAFSGCDALASVYISDITAWCGIDFGNYSSNPLNYAKNLYLNEELVTDLVIPNSVTTIGDHAFAYCDSLTSVTIPDSVTTIGYRAFGSCDALISVTIPNSVTAIESDAFFGCDALTSVFISDITAWCGIDFGNYSSNPLNYAENLYLNEELVTDLVIPNSVTTIGDYAFYQCDSLTSVTIPDSVTTIGDYAFYRCDSLTSVTIPDSVITIEDYAFYSCVALIAIDVGADNLNYSSLEGVLFDKEQTTLIQFPSGKGGDYIIPDSVTSIESSAFSGCTFLTSVTIPDSVTTIGGSAFYNCTSLTSVTIPDSVTSIESSAFSGCTFLTSVTIPDSVTTIGSSSFSGCTSLTSVTIGNSVTTIGDYAFYRCDSLTDVHYHGTRKDKAAIAIGYSNYRLTYAIWHYYDNACDTDCNDCGEVREVPNHVYDHSHDAECNVCGYVREVAPHTYVGVVTTPNNCGNSGVITYTCTACGDTYTETLPPVGAHVYDNGFDADCNVCGDLREVDIPENAPTFVVEDVTAYPGREFTVAVRTLNNSGIVSLKLAVGYDADVLELVTMAEGDFSSLSFGPMTNNPFIVNWVDAIHPNNTTDGVVVYLTFRVKEGAALGDTAITVTYNQNDVYDYDFNNVAFLVESGTVTVTDCVLGDLNNDGDINNKDLGLLQRYINEWDVTVNLAAADVDGNGSVNNMDLGQLQRYLNGWDVTLG